MNPVELGNLAPFAATTPRLREAIFARIAAENYPNSYIHYVDAHEKTADAGATCLVLPPGVAVSETLRLDWDQQWVQQHGIAAIFCEGDLSIAGDLLNLNINSGPLLVVTGNLSVVNLVSGGGTFLILGDVTASGVVIGEYNDGLMRVGCDLRASLLINLDHDIGVSGALDAPSVDWNEDILADVLVPEVFHEDDDSEVVVQKVLERQRAGLPLLLGGD